MNMRSFKRGMEPPDLKHGWSRKNERRSRVQGTVEDSLREMFEEILQNALKEMQEQNKAGGGSPINAWGTLEGENGQSFKITLECVPPTIPTIPSLN